MAACEKKGGEGGAEKPSGEEKAKAEEKPAEKPAKGGEELTCTDTSGLSESAIKMREQQAYVDHSTKEGKTCANCQLFKPPEKEGTCGGCATLKGPIHPDGYCNLWVKKAG